MATNTPLYAPAEPPTEVRNLRVVNADDTSITIQWNRPAVTGRSDFYYEIVITDTSDGKVTTVESEYRDSSATVTYTIHDLKPATRYTIVITTHNGVSGQDSDNKGRRIVSVTGVTTEGGQFANRNQRNGWVWVSVDVSRRVSCAVVWLLDHITL